MELSINQEQINIVKEVLSKFIFKIRIGGEYGVCLLVYTYYCSSFSKYTKDRPKLNFEGIKRQIKDKILTQTNNYWELEESKIKFVESFVLNKEKEFDSYFKDYINELLDIDVELQAKKFEDEEKEEQNRQDEQLKLILKERYSTYKQVVEVIMKDDLNYPCKSDKIKAFLEIKLDVDSIYFIMNRQEKWIVQRGYVDKYSREREQAIKDKKIKVYETQSVIDEIIRKSKQR